MSAVKLPVLLAALASFATLAQANFGFLTKSPGGHFTEDDWRQLKQTMLDVLDASDPAAVKSWSNQASGNRGDVKTLKAYSDQDGHPCKLLQIDNQGGGYTGSSKYTLCRQPNGDWLSKDGGFSLPGRASK